MVVLDRILSYTEGISLSLVGNIWWKARCTCHSNTGGPWGQGVVLKSCKAAVTTQYQVDNVLTLDRGGLPNVALDGHNAMPCMLCVVVVLLHVAMHSAGQPKGREVCVLLCSIVYSKGFTVAELHFSHACALSCCESSVTKLAVQSSQSLQVLNALFHCCFRGLRVMGFMTSALCQLLRTLLENISWLTGWHKLSCNTQKPMLSLFGGMVRSLLNASNSLASYFLYPD